MKTLAFSLFILTATAASAQTPYTYSNDGSGIILNGLLTKYILANDTSFAWYKQSASSYTPSAEVVNAFSSAPANVTLMIFGGTWCEDTQTILPKFFGLQEKSGFPDSRISFFGVDRSKKSIGNVAGVMGITNVPTIIVLKDGKEAGRVIEYGKTGRWDEELAALLR